ncbi:MAG: SDR family oxidoreductase [Streptosporangiaceae bacterium]
MPASTQTGGGLLTILQKSGGYTSEVPLRRPGTPEEVAAVCAFLASDAASIVTGTIVMADGGASVVDLPTLAFERPPSTGR